MGEIKDCDGVNTEIDISLYRVVLDNSSDPIFCFDKAGTYLYVNNAFASPFNKKPTDIIGKKIWSLFPGEEGDLRFAAVKNVFETGEKKVLEVRVPTETVLQYYVTTVIPVKDEKGNVNIVICSSKDITDRKQIEDALIASEEKYRLLITQMQQGMAVYEVI